MALRESYSVVEGECPELRREQDWCFGRGLFEEVPAILVEDEVWGVHPRLLAGGVALALSDRWVRQPVLVHDPRGRGCVIPRHHEPAVRSPRIVCERDEYEPFAVAPGQLLRLCVHTPVRLWHE